MSKFKFKIQLKSSKSQARLGKIITPNGEIETPAFVVVATNAAVKGGIDDEDLKKVKTQVVLGNTYHLLVRGQVSVIKRAGGLAKFMNWPGPTFTDSGGYQVFSLGQRLTDGVGKFSNYDKPKNKQVSKPRKKLVKIKEKGVEFRSHIDGKLFRLSPEKAINIQNDIGADMIFTFDLPTSPIASYQQTKTAMELTHRWAKRCLIAHNYNSPQPSLKLREETKKPPLRVRGARRVMNSEQALFGIIQGGPYEDLRRKSAEFIASLDFPGFGIGGSYHRIKGAQKFKELEAVVPVLPENKPRHFLGIGGVEDMLIAVKQGMDTFDCVIPTREARHGRLYLRVRSGFGKSFYKVINITNAKFKNDKKPVNSSTLKNCSRSYLYHLFKTQELLGIRLASINNLEFYTQFMADIRTAVKKGVL